jgi:maltose/moltooligosaccharide transporter
MAVSMVPKERVGVYMGILNMMIVIPMLIETVTFGWIFHNLLGGQGTNAIIMAGTMLAWGAIAMLWVKDPDAADDSPIVPLATHRHITVYNRVVVGSDGSPSSLHAVAMAAGVANAADAHLVVVSAYNPQAGAGSVGSPRKELRAEEDARSVLRAAVAQPTSERTRQIDQRIVAGDPASALLWNHRDESRRACWQTNAREAVACIE